MREIPLTQNKVAIVDDEDFERVNQCRWYADYSGHTWYAVRYTKIINGKQFTQYMHRVIMNTPENIETDHRNHDGLDNQKHNLRNCTHADNSHNRKPHKRKTTSKYKGVYWNKHGKKWRANIVLNGKQINLGYYVNEISAALAYDIKATELFGEYAYLNFGST